MLYIFSNSDDKSIHHIVCTDSDIRAGIIISRIYERERISGEPIRVQFYNDTSVRATVDSVAKRYDALKATDKSSNAYKEEISTATSVEAQYNELINDIIFKYRNDRRCIALKDFVYNYIELNGYNPKKVYNDVNAEVYKRITKGFKEELKAKVAALGTSDNDDDEEFRYSSKIRDIVSAYYKDKLNDIKIEVIKRVARNNNYDVDKFVKDARRAHKDAYSAYLKHKVNIKKSNSNKDEK